MTGAPISRSRTSSPVAATRPATSKAGVIGQPTYFFADS